MNELEVLSYFIGVQPSLVQGAGGNVSIKNENELHIKSSGKLLATAFSENISTKVCIDDDQLMSCIGSEREPTWSFQGDRPSIETSFHMYFRKKYVVHYHPMHLLPELMKVDFYSEFVKNFNDYTIHSVKYIKPGIKLTKRIFESGIARDDDCIVLLQNHGIIIASNDMQGIIRKISEIEFYSVGRYCKYCENPVSAHTKFSEFMRLDKIIPGVRRINDINLVEKFWRITPDHIVFLGPEPVFWSSNISGREIYFFNDDGSVFVNKNLLNEQILSLINSFCFTMSAIDQNLFKYNTLSTAEVDELINWDAEKYRQSNVYL